MIIYIEFIQYDVIFDYPFSIKFMEIKDEVIIKNYCLTTFLITFLLSITSSITKIPSDLFDIST